MLRMRGLLRAAKGRRIEHPTTPGRRTRPRGGSGPTNRGSPRQGRRACWLMWLEWPDRD